MKIFIGCDHRGTTIKAKLINYLKSNNLDIEDIGLANSEADDYPIFAFKLGELVTNNPSSLGILICATGVGMCIAANKVKGIRCVRAVSVDDAFKAKNHNGCNVLALGSEQTPDLNLVKEIVDTFISTKTPNNPKYLERIDMIKDYEEHNA